MEKHKKLIKIKIHGMIEEALEKISGRRCEDCRYKDLIFCRRNDEKGIECRERLFPVGWEKKEDER